MRTFSSATVKYDLAIVGGGPSGLFLSILLSKFGIKHCVIERRSAPTRHPQAHFINARSVEIIRSHTPRLFRNIMNSSSQSVNWRDFCYCYSVTGEPIVRIDHFDNSISKIIWNSSPTNVIHLPQSTFECLLREELSSLSVNSNDRYDHSPARDVETNQQNDSLNVLNTATNGKAVHYFGYDVVSMKNSLESTLIECRNNDAEVILLDAKYLIAADGANSFIRKQILSIKMTGQSTLQTLINVHFVCKGLYQRLSPRPAMLYFVFNDKLIGVFVGHDPVNDEWVCQIPIFPPFQQLQDYSTLQLEIMIKSGLGLESSDLSVDILSKSIWSMNAEVASSFHNPNKNIFLIGDACHRFPPAGGFGMNSGLQDAHNIAWKIALVIKGYSSRDILVKYAQERKLVADANTKLSMRNYYKSVKIAELLLGINPATATTAVKALSSSYSPLPSFISKTAVQSALALGISSLKWLDTDKTRTSGNRPSDGEARSSMLDLSVGKYIGSYRVSQVRDYVKKGSSLPLIFPREDIGYSYDEVTSKSSDSNDNDNNDRMSAQVIEQDINSIRIDYRLPHVWFTIHDNAKANMAIYSSNRQRYTDVVLSSLDVNTYLPLLFNKLRSIRPRPIIDNISQPLVSIFTSDCYFESWQRVLSLSSYSGLFQLINVIDPFETATLLDSEVKLHHNSLQAYLQEPRYHTEKGVNTCDVKDQYLSKSASDTNLVGIHRLFDESIFDDKDIQKVKYNPDDATAGFNCWHLADITQRWKQMIKSINTDSTMVACAVVVRPDGYVLDIVRVNRNQVEITPQLLENIHSKLFFI